MKKILLLSLTLLISISSFSQNKFGYINSEEIMQLMPETKKFNEEIQTFSKTLQSQMQAMEAELQRTYQEYQNNIETYDPLVKKDKESEIQSLQIRMQEFEQNAQQALQSKQQELSNPIIQKVQQAIDDVAKEGDYTYIFERGMGAILYVKESENILEKVKKKLNL